jgi:PadR family transcriptional regulator, regulatory protein PadR
MQTGGDTKLTRIDDPMDNLASELRRGALVLSVLSQLKEKQYGYSLVQRLSEKGLEVDQGTLYPLLRRLEKQNLLDSDWALEEARPRRYYVLSQEGSRTLEQLTGEWDEMVKVLDRLLGREEREDR